MQTIKPPRLRRGDTIGVITPASAPSDFVKIDNGIKYLEGLGYRVKLGKNAKRPEQLRGYLAGTDEQRVSDINEMFADKQVKAIFSVRGGYGTPRLLNLVDYNLIKRNPKILVGYSDLTALQLAIFRRTGLITFSGPMVAVEMHSGMDPFTEEHFWRVITSPKKIGKLLNPDSEPLKVLRKGDTTALLIGGNLSLINTLIGTSYLPNFAKNILLIEEVEEEPYRVDRFLLQLYLARILKKIGGLVIGCLTDCVPKDKEKPSLTIEEVISDYTYRLDVPVVSNLIYGHVPRKLTIPIGIRARLNAARAYLELLEGAVI